MQLGAWLWVGLGRAGAAVVIAAVRAYQVFLSPLLGAHCRFQPTCSQYCIEAVHRYGVVRGGLKSLRRIARCHPWHSGGYDPP
ncbi:MAG: membrane protein insertion efficiency factor YidD [Pirellulales bacterium]|jgi:putative membrane protein insertion efficiency factor